MSSYSRRGSAVPLFLVALLLMMSWSSAIDNRHDAHTETTLSDIVVAHVGWSSSTTLDSTDNVGYYSSLAVDSNDNLHVTYRDGTNGNLEYMTYDGSSWSTPITLDSTDNVGRQSSLAIDSNDNLHVTYLDNTNLNLEYMTYDGSSWSTPVSLDSTDEVGYYSSLAIDSNDNLHVTYLDNTNDNLEYMTYDGSSWSTPVSLDSTDNVGWQSSLAIDSNDNLHVTYLDNTNGNLEYMTYDGSSWSTPVSLDSTDNVGRESSLAIDSSDNLHVTYLDTTNENLEYMTYDGSSWSTPVSLDSTDNVGGESSLAIDSNDNLHVSYLDSTNDNLEYITHDGSSWSTPVSLDSTGNVGQFSSLAIDSNDNLHVTYLDSSNVNLEYMMYAAAVPPVISYSPSEFSLIINTAMSPTAIPNNSGSTITSGTLDTTGTTGTHTSIALDSNDHRYVSYSDQTNADLKFMTDKSGSWVNSTLDSTGDVGQYTSIATDSNDDVHISYYDGTNGDLKYATDTSGSWVLTTLDSTGDVGQYTSIDLDSNNDVHISYYGVTGADLKYATCSSSCSTVSSWTDITLDSTGGVGQYSSLIVDSSDEVHISYYDATTNSGDLKYATCSSSCSAVGSWTNSVADGGWTTSGWHSSIAVDAGGDVHISHQDFTYDSLAYSTYNGATWTTTRQVGSMGGFGSYSSIALDSSGNPHISYHANSGNDLKYAKYIGSSWSNSILVSSGDVGKYTSIAADSNDGMHISFSDFSNGDLAYFAMDASSNPYGYSVSPALPGGLNLNDTTGEISGIPSATSPLTPYTVTALNIRGTSTASINITVSSGAPMISYSPSEFNLTNNTLVSVLSPTNTGAAIGNFSTVSNDMNTTLDSVGNSWGLFSSMAIDSKGNLHVSYCETNGFNLKYATNASGSWVYTTVDSTASLGEHSSLAIDSNDAIHISYFDYSNGDLKYATDKSGSWVITMLDSIGFVGQETSLAIDSNDAVHISYRDGTNQALKYATDMSGSWVYTTIDSSANVGVYSTSLAVDSAQHVHIAYFDNTNKDLKYATNKSGSWVYTALDSTGDVGSHASMVIDSNDALHISYLYNSLIDLKYATDASGSWVYTTVDSPLEVGFFSSIALDSNENRHISYYDTSGNDFKYATDASGSWVSKTLDSSGDVGEYSSLAIDSNDDVHFSYHDNTNGNLKYGNITTTVTSGFTISPALPQGLFFNSSTGTLSGTPSVLFSRTMFTITGTNSIGTGTTNINISVTSSPPILSYSPDNAVLMKNSTMSPLFATNTGGAITSWSISPELSLGLNMNAINGQISGLPLALQPLTMYTITATNDGGSATATVNITVNDIQPVLSYSPDHRTVTNNSIMEVLSPTNSGGAIVSWSILPALSTGLNFDSSNGQITGTPDSVRGLTMYAITAVNTGGSSTATVNITVLLEIQPPVISSSLENVTLTRGIDMMVLVPVSAGGDVVNWSILPDLPNGLSFGETNGSIWGASIVNMSRTQYTVQATNTAGNTFMSFNLTVNEPEILIALSPLENLILTRGIPMLPLVPELSDGLATTWEIQPMQPAGLSFVSGVLSGTPSENMTQMTFTIWANNSNSFSHINFTIVILEPTPTVSYSLENLTLIRGDTMTLLEPLLGEGLVEYWGLNASLPDGLLFDNGSISGTPLVNSTSTIHTVWAWNSGGIAYVSINLTILEPVSILSIDPAEFSLTQDNTTMAVLVKNTGGMVEQWQISPSLPIGLKMQNGFISGIAAENQSETIYTIWGNNSGGSSSVTFTLTVFNPDVEIITPSPSSSPLILLLILIGTLLAFLLLFMYTGVFTRKHVEEQKLALVPGQEGENQSLLQSSTSDADTHTIGQTLYAGMPGENTGPNAGVNPSSETLVSMTSTLVPVEGLELNVADERTNEEKLLHLPTVVEITEARTGKEIVDLPSVAAPSQMLTGKKIVDLLPKPVASEKRTGKEIVDLPDSLGASEMLTGKKIVDLLPKPVASEKRTGKEIVDLPSEVTPSQMLTGKKVAKFTANPEAAKLQTGKTVVDLPDGLSASEMLTGKTIDTFPSVDASLQDEKEE
jgi:hypothetical protein